MGYWYDDYDDFDYGDDFTLSDYEVSPDTVLIEGPLYAQSRRGDIGSEWWSMAWVEVLQQLGYDSRMQRGKTYARNGSVKHLQISHGMVYAEVSGSRYKPYRTAIHLSVLDDEAWDAVLAALSKQAIYAAKLLAGEMPPDIETLFQQAGYSLFPRNSRDLNFECSCPDWGDPCKHATAVYYLVAEQLDIDPFLLFHLRGRNREGILDALRLPEGVEDVQAENSVPALTVADFWDAPAPPMTPIPKPDAQPHVLKELGAPPDGVQRGLTSIFRQISNEARRWLGL